MPALVQRLTIPLLTVFFALLVFFLFVKLFGPIPFSITSVTTTKTDLFTATGVGEAAAVPSIAQISLGATKRAESVEDAKTQTTVVINKLTADLKSLGIEEKDIKTTDYNVSPEYTPNQVNQTMSGYTVTQNLSVKVKDAAKANKAVDIATKDGVNIVGGISFVLDDDARMQLEQKARVEAIDQAKKKAVDIAHAAGIRLGRIINISENPSSQPVPMAGGVMMDKATNNSVPTQLNPGENNIQITITLSYETL